MTTSNAGNETPKQNEKTQTKKYQVYVDDNFHFMDEDERYKLGEFETCKEAVAACKKIVDDFLEKGYKEGMSFEELYGGYTGFGEDPFIVSDDEACLFSAWGYAKSAPRNFAEKRNRPLAGLSKAMASTTTTPPSAQRRLSSYIIRNGPGMFSEENLTEGRSLVFKKSYLLKTRCHD